AVNGPTRRDDLVNVLHPNRIFRDILLLLARVGLGAVFLAHGLEKFITNGVDGTAEGFAAMGVPLPTVSAWFAALVETIGGTALILGVLTPVFGVLLAIVTVGALLIVHLPNGIWVADNGYELVLALTA